MKSDELRVGLVVEMVEPVHRFLQLLGVVSTPGHEVPRWIRDMGRPGVDWRGECGGMW